MSHMWTFNTWFRVSKNTSSNSNSDACLSPKLNHFKMQVSKPVFLPMHMKHTENDIKPSETL